MVLCNCKIQPNPFPANQNHSSWTYIYQACSSWTTQIHDWSSVSPLQTPKQKWAFRIKENKENILTNSLLRKVSSIWHHICNASWLFWTCKTNSYLEWGNTEISKSAGQTHILKTYFKSVIKPDKLSNKCCFFCTNIVKKCVFQVQPWAHFSGHWLFLWELELLMVLQWRNWWFYLESGTYMPYCALHFLAILVIWVNCLGTVVDTSTCIIKCVWLWRICPFWDTVKVQKVVTQDLLGQD